MTKVIDWTMLLLIDENEWLNGLLIELLIDWLKCYYETFNVKYHCNLVALFPPITRHLNTQWHNFTIVYPYISEWNLWLLQYVGLKVKIKKTKLFLTGLKSAQFSHIVLRTNTHMFVTKYLINSSIYPLGVVILQPYVTLSRSFRHYW